MSTNTNEAHEFIGNIPTVAWLLSTSVIVSGIATIVSSFSGHKNASITREVYGFLALFFVASARWSPFRQGNTAELNNNIVALASRAGFETWWISNLGRKGHVDSPVALMEESADHSYFTKSANSNDRMDSPDDQLLPHLDTALKQEQGKKLIVLHLMGPHPQACVKTRDQYDIDMGAKEISYYIKSIAITDSLLAQIHEMAKRDGGDGSMMYFSDHGLSYINKGTADAYLTHGDKTRENYHVPFFIIDKDQTHPGTTQWLTFSENIFTMDENSRSVDCPER
ncbi:sulfatase-like hydrolase/transferase [Erwinia endophytica]|uniref:sulfatase-like hydrolase/transferase n=1 Tax=Erwinia endophytica TaxID=1563158 RepID=UPI00186BAD3E|nr:sulfatase-like hydrolase/transferase [Erwinia endophytica]